MVLTEIATICEEKIPTTIKELRSLVRRASKKTTSVEVWNKLSESTQDYLTAARRSLQEQQEIPLPEDFVDYTGVAKDDQDDIDETQGPAPFKFKTTSNGKNYSVGDILQQMDQGRLKLPSFQRKFVWNLQTKQAFIRAVLNDIPIIGLTFTIDLEYGNDRYIMDGFQRLSTLRDFRNGVFSLGKNTEYGDTKFDDMPRDLRNKFLYKEIMVNEVQANKTFWPYIFRMINKGGLPLKDDEIRRATPWGSNHQQHPVIEVIDELAENHSQWLEIFGKNSRYKGFGALVRGVAMHHLYLNYTKKMYLFLDSFCSSIDELKIDANNIQERLALIFAALCDDLGKVSMRTESGKPVNAGLCDCMLHAGLLLTADPENFPDSDELGAKLRKVREALLADKAKSNEEIDGPLYTSLTQDTSGKASVITRMSAVEAILADM